MTLLQLAERHQQPLALESNSYRQRLERLAAQKALEAAQAQQA